MKNERFLSEISRHITMFHGILRYITVHRGISQYITVDHRTLTQVTSMIWRTQYLQDLIPSSLFADDPDQRKR